jgi:hypothetical protein
MYEAFKALQFDDTLTVRNAYSRGYEYADIDIGQFSPPEIIESAMDLVKNKGYKIGKARMWWVVRGKEEQDRGLYKPLQQKRQR